MDSHIRTDTWPLSSPVTPPYLSIWQLEHNRQPGKYGRDPLRQPEWQGIPGSNERMLACPDLRYSALDPSASGPASQNEWKWREMVGYKKKIGPRALHKKWDS